MCSLQTPDEARGKVDELYAEGVHALKIYDQLQPSLAQVVIDEARELALPVCGHLGKTTAREAISYGVSGVEHLTSLIFELYNGEPRNPFSQDLFCRVSEIDLHSSDARRLCDSVVGGGIYIDPTLVVYDRIRRFPELKGREQLPVIPPQLRDYWLVRMSKFVREWVKSDFELATYSFDKLKSWLKFIESEGAPICAGTDTPNPYLVPGQALLDEIKLLAEAGLSNKAALGAATFVAAKALNQAAEIGAIETGKRADFLLLQNDPLADISAVEKIDAVFKDGVRYEPETLLRVAAEMSAGGPS